jgi:hypothetical protein
MNVNWRLNACVTGWGVSGVARYAGGIPTWQSEQETNISAPAVKWESAAQNGSAFPQCS